MNTATATLGNLSAMTAGLNLPVETDRYLTRWVFYPLRDLRHPNLAYTTAQTPDEQTGRLRRMVITRVRNNEQWEPAGCLPREAIIKTRNPGVVGGLPREEAALIPALNIVNSLFTIYGSSGLVELTALKGRDDVALGETLTNLFFPEPVTTAAEARARILSVMNDAGQSRDASATLVQQAAADLLRSINTSEQFTRQELDHKHAEIKKAENGNTGAIGYYDSRDYLHLAWASVTPRDQALDTLATGHNDLLKSLPAVLKELKMESPGLDEEKLGRAIAAGFQDVMAQLMVQKVTTETTPGSTKK